MSHRLKTKSRKLQIDRDRKRAEISPERVKQFERLLGREWRGSVDSAHGSALMVLCDRGYITECMRDKGHDFKKLFDMFFPGVKTSGISELSGQGSIDSLPENRIEELAINERYLRRARDVIQSVEGAYSTVYIVAVSGMMPSWLTRRMAIEDGTRREVENWRVEEINNFVPTKTMSIVQHKKKINKSANNIMANIRGRVSFKMTINEEKEFNQLNSGLQALVDGGKQRKS